MQDYRLLQRRRLAAPKGSTMVCGLPDSGFVAKIAVDHLIGSLKAVHVADVLSPHLPPQVIVKDTGAAELVSHQLYVARKGKLLIYTGDSQPVDGRGAYTLSGFIVELARRYAVREVVVLAALVKGSPVEVPRVLASATDSDVLERYLSLGAEKTGPGTITWMHGLILGQAGKAGIEAVCLSGETKGDLPDSRAAEALLGVLEKRLGLPLDLPALRREREEMGKLSEAGPQPSSAPQQAPEGRKPTYIG